MIMKLTGLRDLVGATPDPKGFGHNSISKKMRLMQKNYLTWLGNIRIFYHFRSFEMVKNVIMFTFWRRKSLLSVVKLCFLVLWILQTLHYIPRNHLVVKKNVKKILDGFKIEHWPSKNKKHQNILPFQELWCFLSFEGQCSILKPSKNFWHLFSLPNCFVGCSAMSEESIEPKSKASRRLEMICAFKT